MSRKLVTEKEIEDWMNSQISKYDEDGDLKDCRKIQGVRHIYNDDLGPDDCNWSINCRPGEFPKIIIDDAKRLFNLK